jgi:hypothetical protein
VRTSGAKRKRAGALQPLSPSRAMGLVVEQRYFARVELFDVFAALV